jgi:hypothetical protein
VNRQFIPSKKRFDSPIDGVDTPGIVRDAELKEKAPYDGGCDRFHIESALGLQVPMKGMELLSVEAQCAKRETACAAVDEKSFQLTIEVGFLTNPQRTFRLRHEKTPFAATVD